MKKISTRARNVLIQEKILTCERLLRRNEKDFFNIGGVGIKTVNDIRRLQEKIAKLHPVFSKSNKNVQIKDPVGNDQQTFIHTASTSPRLENTCLPNALDSSLLSRTLPEIFQTLSQQYDYSNDESQSSIGSLGIASQDINRLRLIALFPDDPADVLCHVTVGYLLQSDISEEAFSCILDHLSSISGFTNRSEMTISVGALSDDPIFTSIPPIVIAELRLSQHNMDTAINGEVRTMIWENITLLSEKNIIASLGFSMQGLKTIWQVWYLKEQGLELMNTLSKGIPIEAYGNFKQLVDEFLWNQVKREREGRILKGRLGLLDGRKWTLEELGYREKITRERVRQIEEKYISKLQKPKSLSRLDRFWHAVDDVLLSGGGVCCVQEIANALGKRWGWRDLPSDEELASLIGFSPQYEIVWSPPIRVIIPKHQCVRCQAIRSELARSVENQPDGVLPFDVATVKMMEFCRGKTCCNRVTSIAQFSNGYLHFLDDALEEILADESALYTQYAWTLKYGKKRTLLVETILYNTGRPMHFTEVYAEVNKDRPEHEKISERKIYAYIERSPDLLLWDRGTYIHRDHVSIPFGVIAEIEHNIISRLEGDIPYLSVSGIFEQYKEKLLKENILNESALYTCLRESNNPALRYPDYPYVIKSEKVEQRLPLPLILEKFVLEQEGVVKLEQIRKYAVEQLCANEAVFMARHFPNTPNILRVNHGEYIHIQHTGIQKERLPSIIEHLTTLLSSSGHISVIKLFNDRKITCKLLGIVSPMLLYSIFQNFYSDEYDLSRYPLIRLFGVIEENGCATGVAAAILNFIRDKGEPCSFSELYQHFVDDLGYKQNSVYNVLYHYKDVMRYSEGVFVHIETLRWTGNNQAGLELMAAQYLRDRESAGKPFGLISHFYDYMHDKLPVLPDHLLWTPTLIGELLSREGKYCIIGSLRNAFVSIPNSWGIETLDDLLYYILSNEYDGAANINVLVADMREAGILKKVLTPMMLGAKSRVVIDGNVVQLAGLRDRAKRT